MATYGPWSDSEAVNALKQYNRTTALLPPSNRFQMVQTASTSIPNGGTTATTLGSMSSIAANGGFNAFPGITLTTGSTVVLPAGSAGVYRCSGRVAVTTGSGVTAAAGVLQHNGAVISGGAGQESAGGSVATIPIGPIIFSCTDNDTLSLGAYSVGAATTSSVATAFGTALAYSSYLLIEQIA